MNGQGWFARLNNSLKFGCGVFKINEFPECEITPIS